MVRVLIVLNIIKWKIQRDKVAAYIRETGNVKYGG